MFTAAPAAGRMGQHAPEERISIDGKATGNRQRCTGRALLVKQMPERAVRRYLEGILKSAFYRLPHKRDGTPVKKHLVGRGNQMRVRRDKLFRCIGHKLL